MKARTWFVSTGTALVTVVGKGKAFAMAKQLGGLVHAVCECGCGKPASKPTRPIR